MNGHRQATLACPKSAINARSLESHARIFARARQSELAARRDSRV